MRAKPLNLRQSNEYIQVFHRHHGKVQGYKFAIGCIDDNGALVGVVVIGRPVARMLDNGYTAEVTRLCTDGHANACSFLYAAAARAAKAMGYTKIITYILESESGASLKASGWTYGGICGGGSWNRESRKREDKSPVCKKQMYFRNL